MKKAKHVTFQLPANSELSRFKPLYLLSTENHEQSGRICIFISSDEKKCYIQEKGHWSQLTIDDLLFDSTNKTYCFPIKNTYRYLDIPCQDFPYLTLTKNAKCKILLKNLELSEEIFQELALPNLEQLDTSMLPKTKLEAEEVLHLEAQIIEINAKLNQRKTNLHAFKEAKEAMKKLDSDEKDPFSIEDINDQIKLINRQIHYYGYVKLKKEVKREALLTKGTHLKSELYERLLILRTQEKETLRGIESTESGICALKKMAETFSKDSSQSLEDPFIEVYINQEIQLIKKKNSKDKLELENIKEKIKILKEPNPSQDIFLVTSKAKQPFFNNKGQKNNSIKVTETELKNLNL